MATPVVFSWSAGKDSAYALWTLLRDPAYDVEALLTTITDEYDRVSISGVREELLDQQAMMLGLPLIKVRIPPTCTNEIYEQRMAAVLTSPVFDGIDHLAFGDGVRPRRSCAATDLSSVMLSRLTGRLAAR